MTYPGNAGIEMFTLFEMTPDLVCIAGKDGYFRKINPAVSKTLEFSEEELYSRPIHSFIHPDDAGYTALERGNLLNGKPLLNFQNRYISKSGKVIWLEWTSVYLQDREIVFAIAKNITEQKIRELEREEKFQAYKVMASHFKTRVEEDRRYLAYALHEEVAQLAAAVKLQLAWISKNVESSPVPVQDKVAETLMLSELLVKTVRRICFSVSPKMLEDIGFLSTLEWQSAEFTVLYGIACFFSADCSEEDIPDEIKMDFFRICQETFTGIAEKQDASRVRISLDKNTEGLLLSIRVDSKLHPESTPAPQSWLRNLQHLALSINGRLTVMNEEEGTRVMVCVDPAA